MTLRAGRSSSPTEPRTALPGFAWIAVELAFIKAYSWFHPTYLVAAIVVLGLSWLMNLTASPAARPARLELQNALGTVAAEHLSRAIYERTDGNPYLTHLLLRELEPDTRTLPDRLPTAPADALRAVTAALDANARDVCALVAVGGEPVAPGMLAAVCAEAGLAVELDTALRQAADAAVLERRSAAEWWFVHHCWRNCSTGIFSCRAAKAELWDRDPVGVRRAAEADERARTSGSARAFARALVSRAFASAETGRIDAALSDLKEAFPLTVQPEIGAGG
jgi:hypothetical protein